MDFKTLKKNSKSLFQKVQEQTDSLKSSGFETDPELWYPGVGKDGNGFALIRFLPPISEDDLPFVRWWNHSFQNKDTGKWYIEMSRTTLGRGEVGKDPVSDYNNKLWNSTKDVSHPNRKLASLQKRKINFQTNIYVIKDSTNPENNGKVKKFKFGQKLFDKLEAAMYPNEASGQEPLNPFDLFEGSNFRIEIFTKQTTDGPQRDYSNSRFEDKRGPLGDDKMMEAIWNQIAGKEQYSLKALIEPEKFKSYDELLVKLNEVIGFDTTQWKAESIVSQLLQERPAVITQPVHKEASAPVFRQEKTPVTATVSSNDEEIDFASLVSDD